MMVGELEMVVVPEFPGRLHPEQPLVQVGIAQSMQQRQRVKESREHSGAQDVREAPRSFAASAGLLPASAIAFAIHLKAELGVSCCMGTATCDEGAQWTWRGESCAAGMTQRAAFAAQAQPKRS